MGEQRPVGVYPNFPVATADTHGGAVDELGLFLPLTLCLRVRRCPSGDLDVADAFDDINATTHPGVMTSLLDDIRTGLYAFLDNSNVIVTALTALVILATRSAGILYFAVGAVVCSRTVKFVKRFIRQPRPLNPLPDRQKESYGMPSTHSAVIAYYGAYTVLAALYLPLHHSLQSIPAVRALALVIVVPWATAIAVSRTWLGHHTWLQVGAGCLHGLAFTYMWFSIWVGGVNERGWELEQRYLARV